MKILILYAKAGGGHKKAAEALGEWALSAGYEVLLVDALAEVGAVVNHAVCDSYQVMARHIPGAFGFLYRRANHPSLLAELMPYLNEKFCHKLLPTLRDFAPDVVISTYHFATEMISALKGQGLHHGALINVITDYGLHRAWLAENVDAYVTACEEMTAPLVAEGVAAEKIFPLGIPVKAAFGEKMTPAQARQVLGLLPNRPTILLMAGSFGVGRILAVYREIAALAGNFQLVVICGRNEKLYQDFCAEIHRTDKPTKVVGFTQRVATYMQASDLLVTKAGGLTISEALASGLPMVVYDAIPGQEEDNARFLENRGIALCTAKELPAANAVALALANPVKFAAMRQAAAQFDKGDAAAKIVKLAVKLAEDKTL